MSTLVYFSYGISYMYLSHLSYESPDLFSRMWQQLDLRENKSFLHFQGLNYDSPHQPY
jgi:hypothetical protein